MFVLFIGQQDCVPCAKAFPGVVAICTKLQLELKTIDVTNDWEFADSLGVKTTPTIFVVNEENNSMAKIEFKDALQFQTVLLDLTR